MVLLGMRVQLSLWPGRRVCCGYSSRVAFVTSWFASLAGRFASLRCILPTWFAFLTAVPNARLASRFTCPHIATMIVLYCHATHFNCCLRGTPYHYYYTFDDHLTFVNNYICCSLLNVCDKQTDSIGWFLPEFNTCVLTIVRIAFSHLPVGIQHRRRKRHEKIRETAWRGHPSAGR